MGNLLGRTKSPKKVPSRVTEQDRIVLQMKQQRDKLKQHQRQLETRLEKERQVASRLVKEGKKERALIILKKKKYMEKIIEKTENHLEKIERLTRDVEWAQIEVNVVRNLEQGNEALKSLTALINLDDIEKMLDETRDAAEVQREISDLIIGVAPEIEVDDDALLSELDELIKVEQPAVEPNEPEKILKLPEVPAGDIEHEPSEIILQRNKNKSQKELEMVPA
ncbi:charged multivesicular body protein 6-like [Varroa jacobsoni]|uniref:Charged multivesicular body protein 6 n=1 Tax=Varroa destructor TaxID=109461 RepID=A0A7M7K6Y8_VARDE|nr:charged multivesicular body protein 6-like [Varroa destructor]XP_022661357.1 charged multivesicular body protein 6-like [Varroa destructor]XP_022710239.1 charged multivesicular body protein 6-like [Varroa jacobsoni]